MNFQILLFSLLRTDLSHEGCVFISYTFPSCSMISHPCVENLSVFHMIDLLGGGGVLVKMVVGKITSFHLGFHLLKERRIELFTSCELFRFPLGEKAVPFKALRGIKKNAPRLKKVNKRQCSLSKTALEAGDKVLVAVRIIETKTCGKYRQNQEEICLVSLSIVIPLMTLTK